MGQIQCDICPEYFNRQSSLTRHKTSLHSDSTKLFKCSTCSKEFSRRDLLLRHERLHRGEGLKACEICSRYFRGDYVSRHVKTCRLKLRSPLAGSSTNAKSSSAPPQLQERRETHEMQWQIPNVAPASPAAVREADKPTEEGTQQSYRRRHMPVKDAQQLVTEGELLDQAILAIENWDGELSTFSSVVDVWRKRGFSMRRLLSIEADGLNLLARASYSTHEITAYLLTLDIDVDTKDTFGRTVLHWLSRNGLTDLVEKILSRVQNVSTLDKIEDTPLCLASRHGHIGVVKLLCDHGADVNAKGLTPRYFANSAVPNHTPLEIAIRGRRREVATTLLAAGANPNLRGERMPLEAAIAHGGSEDVKLLLEAGADIDLVRVSYINLLEGGLGATTPEKSGTEQASQKRQVLEFSGRSSQLHQRTRSRSLDYPAERDIRNSIGADDITSFANKYCENATLGAMREFFETSQSSDLSPLMQAARDGAVNCLHYMLRYWPNISATDGNGWTALHHACDADNDQTIHLLLKSGASVDYCSEAVSTPLCIAAMKGNRKTMAKLVEAGASVDGKTPISRESPLYWACAMNQRWAVSLLISEGADVNYSGTITAPLEVALQYGSAALVSTLLSAGASTDGIHETYRHELTIASAYGSTDVWLEAGEKIRLLDTASARENANAIDVEVEG